MKHKIMIISMMFSLLGCGDGPSSASMPRVTKEVFTEAKIQGRSNVECNMDVKYDVVSEKGNYYKWKLVDNESLCSEKTGYSEWSSVDDSINFQSDEYENGKYYICLVSVEKILNGIEKYKFTSFEIRLDCDDASQSDNPVQSDQTKGEGEDHEDSDKDDEPVQNDDPVQSDQTKGEGEDHEDSDKDDDNPSQSDKGDEEKGC